MFLLNFIILLSGLSVQGYNFALKSSEDSSTSLTLITELLTNCNDLNPKFAIFIGDIDINNEKLFFNVNLISLVLINEKNSWKSIVDNEIILTIQPEYFIINFRTKKNLIQSIEQLKLSPWWNIKSFYIIYTSDIAGNCHEAFNHLWIMWKMDLINSLLICRDDNNEILMFTFNPYTNRAPEGWEITQDPRIHRPWTLFSRSCKKNSSVCSLIKFDKTQNLDGYSGIHAAGFQSDEMKKLNPDDDQISSMLFKTLNLTLKYIVDSDRGYVDGGGIAYGMIKNLTNGNYDIIINSRYPAYAKGIKMSTIIAQSGLAIVSQPRGYVSIVRKIMNYFPFWLFIAIFILSIATAFVLNYSLNNLSFASAMSEVTGFFLDAVFRGRILAFLTIPIPEHNVNSFKDLIQFKDYKIFCDLGMRKFVHPQLKNRCLNISAPIAMTEILTDSQACFISDKYILIHFMVRQNSYWLHLSRNYVINEYGIFMMRNNWPLGDRISQGVSRMFESYLSCLVYKNVYGQDFRKIKMIENRHLIRRFRAIKLNDLSFSFELWAIGITFTIAIFIIEIRRELFEYLKNKFNQFLNN
ncbi:hypothetical protein PV328_007506 [Microctonus aethiopoides]|uniref:Ionotropic receptor n=1 Tax=Microctonus aethiopoides TaxID=144406 RepID=A0AA39C8V4_9HYME|nr:hypothetical protein PV328_007506 [Microctonus aethiopoides]